MERKETITLCELSKRVGDQVSCDTLAHEYLDQMEFQNMPKNEILEKIEKFYGAFDPWDTFYIDDDRNVYCQDETIDDENGEMAFKNIETGKIIIDNDFLDSVEEIDTNNLESDFLDYWLDSIYQWYLIDGSAAEYLTKYSEEIVTYVEKIDCYFWGITEFGTPWEGIEVTMTYDY